MKKIIKIIFIICVIIAITLIGIFIYERITVNNEYSISERNLNIPIFLYHNIVLEDSQVEFDYMQTTKDVFEEQINGLKEYGYDFITYEKLKEYKNSNVKLKKKSCILTFDDGFEGVYENAFPIAKELNIPFTIFVIIDKMENNGYITWKQAKEMQDSGLVTIASHSMEHLNFLNLSVESAVNDVNKSYEIIEEKLGEQKLKIFTYPYGLFTEEQMDELEKLEYIQNITDNRINQSKNLNLSKLHRCYPLSDSKNKMLFKIFYRTLRYGS